MESTGHSPHKGPAMRTLGIFLVVSPNTILDKQSSSCWFETQWHSSHITWMTCTIFEILQMNTSNTLLGQDFTLLPAWINGFTHHKVWNEVPYSFPNLNGAAVQAWKWMSNFIPHFTWQAITYPCWWYIKKLSLLFCGTKPIFPQYKKACYTESFEDFTVLICCMIFWEPSCLSLTRS